jgi:D-glycero-beta-D-manno-heptose 1-phosphate adenylyltransferase
MWTKDKILSREQLPAVLEQWRAAGRRIVFTNGCFDLLHLGHVDYLEKARALGDALVVGLNTDQSVSDLKPGRPLQDEVSRARVLASLLFVDAVVLFGEPTPLELIHLVRPDVLVKGDDYAISGIVGHEFVLANGGQVLTVPLVTGYSTTRIVERVRQTLTGPAAG